MSSSRGGLYIAGFPGTGACVVVEGTTDLYRCERDEMGPIPFVDAVEIVT